ncbi:beta-lactamase family protein [Candidatus Poribacteria bacterium]|nr:beta-lactamase family protein [Candidatus Poribacteria bacterium]
MNLKQLFLVHSLLLSIISCTTVRVVPPPEPVGKPIHKDVGMSSERLLRIFDVVHEAMDKEDIPGAVVLVGRYNEVIFREAIGYSQLVPNKVPMRVDLMFDMSSATKPVATATSIMILAERGQLRLTDRVRNYVPNFNRYVYPDGTEAPDARIWHLLTHTSGVPPYTDADSAAAKLGRPCTTEALVNYIAQLPKLSAPEDEYHYSCLGFITLAYIIEKVSGTNVAEFAKENIFKPLGMNYTTYVPEQLLKPLCVPTQVIDGEPLQGIVHDPLARLQGGISGNAGLFSTADDLAVYARMMLNGGIWDDARILSPVTIHRMIGIPGTKANATRGYGWVVKRGQSWVGGDLLPDGGFGHSGYTGTSMWINPTTGVFIIVLTNRVHPIDDGDVDWLRSSIANVVAGAVMEE